MKVFIVSLFVSILTLLSGCGHNVLTFSSGKYLNLGVDPGTNKLGVQYVNGEQITVVEKDNTILTVEMKDVLEADGKTTSKVSKIVYEIKEQITGADVDMAVVNNK